MINDRLKNLSSRIEGTRALALVARDGMLVDSVSSNGDLDLEALAAELMTQVRAISHNQQELTVGQVSHLNVTTDRFVMMVSAISEEYFLLAVLEEGANAGRARFELRRAQLDFETEL